MTSARITWIGGPVLRAHTSGAFRMREAVSVGEAGLLGEVVRIDGDEIVAQVYEDTTGLAPGAPVTGSGDLFGIRLGPGLLGNIYDGLLRPLTGEVPREFDFVPSVAAGSRIGGGAVFGSAGAQACLVPPDVEGEVLTVAGAGRYRDDAPVLSVRTPAGAVREVALAHFWPVRRPRPVRERLPSDEPLVTGQRILDSVFPVALGGKAAIPGGFGTGKTVLLETLAKACSADVIVYLGCGERGNEMAGVLAELPQLDDPRSGRPLMERTVIIANTSNMPVAAREASIYSAVTVAEYFRDQGLNVALMADSTSRWAEALREISARLGELPGESGYPPYLASRLADFYERAARVRTLGGALGSVTLLGSVSPPSGDLSEPVTSHTRRYVRSFWALDTRRAHARFYPAIDPLGSYSEDAGELAGWWGKVYAGLPREVRSPASGPNEWVELRRRLLTLLQEHARLERMARIIGKDALPPRQQLTLFCAELANEALLRQSAFSEKDLLCGPQRQGLMLRIVSRFVELAHGALDAGAGLTRITSLGCVRRLQRMKDEIGDAELERLVELAARMESEFAHAA